MRIDCTADVFPGLAHVVHRKKALPWFGADISPSGMKITFLMSIISPPDWGLK
ncbi:MAG: hypothetical protein QM681_19005 [Novosphingobium sp.]